MLLLTAHELPSTSSALEITVSVKIGLWISIFSHWICSRVLIIIGWGFFFMYILFYFTHNFILTLKISSLCENTSVRISHVFCILFHPGLVVMDLRCKKQDSTQVCVCACVCVGGGGSQGSLYAVILAIRLTDNPAILYSTHVCTRTRTHTDLCASTCTDTCMCTLCTH